MQVTFSSTTPTPMIITVEMQLNNTFFDYTFIVIILIITNWECLSRDLKLNRYNNNKSFNIYVAKTHYVMLYKRPSHKISTVVIESLSGSLVPSWSYSEMKSSETDFEKYKFRLNRQICMGLPEGTLCKIKMSVLNQSWYLREYQHTTTLN